MLDAKPRKARKTVVEIVTFVAIAMLAVTSLSFVQVKPKLNPKKVTDSFKFLTIVAKEIPKGVPIINTDQIDKDIQNLKDANVRWAQSRGDEQPLAPEEDVGVLNLLKQKLQTIVNQGEVWLAANSGASDEEVIVIWEHNGIRKWVTRQYYNEVVPRILERERIRNEMIARIDGYLHNCRSPMEGLGWAFYDSAARYGIEPRLSVAIAQAESSAGLACFAPHNAWGMLAYRGGFSDWVEGINANNDWLNRYFGSPQTSYDCPGYCEPDHPWMENVQGVLDSI